MRGEREMMMNDDECEVPCLAPFLLPLMCLSSFLLPIMSHVCAYTYVYEHIISRFIRGIAYRPYAHVTDL